MQPDLPTAPENPDDAWPTMAAPRAVDVDWRGFFQDPRLRALIALST